MHGWRHHYKVFPLCFKMVESFEKLDNILHDWEKISTKFIVEALNRYQKQSLAERRKIKLFLSLKNGSEKKYSSSWQSSETKPNAKLVLVNCKPLHYLEFNKPNKQNVPEINSFNKFNFSPSQNNCWPTDYRLVRHFFVLTAFWCHLWSITGQMHGNMESICLNNACSYWQILEHYFHLHGIHW